MDKPLKSEECRNRERGRGGLEIITTYAIWISLCTRMQKNCKSTVKSDICMRGARCSRKMSVG